jgi:hypothetical protein
MLYMFAAVSAPAAHQSGGMGGMSGGVGGMETLDLPFLALLFALVLVGYCIWDLDQVSGPGRRRPGRAEPRLGSFPPRCRGRPALW